MQDDDLDRLLASAARTAAKPSPALMERVLADALAAQPQPQPQVPRPMAAPVPKAGLLAWLAAALGGRSALAGLGSAAVLGVAIGYLSPTTIDYLTGGLSGAAVDPAADTAEFFPGADFLTTEG